MKANYMGATNRWMAAFLRLFFYMIYKPLAWSYDWVATIVSLGKWQQWILSVLDELIGPRLLELGHGPGHLQIASIQRGIWTCGIDASKQMGTLAANRLRQKGMEPNLVNAQAQHLPFAPSSFPEIVATFPTEYILDARTLDEVWRVLCPGGKLVVMPVAWITGRSLLERTAAWLFRVTGQAPAWEDRALEPAKRAGFQIQIMRKELKSSEVLVIQASKVEV